MVADSTFVFLQTTYNALEQFNFVDASYSDAVSSRCGNCDCGLWCFCGLALSASVIIRDQAQSHEWAFGWGWVKQCFSAFCQPLGIYDEEYSAAHACRLIFASINSPIDNSIGRVRFQIRQKLLSGYDFGKGNARSVKVLTPHNSNQEDKNRTRFCQTDHGALPESRKTKSSMNLYRLRTTVESTPLRY